jgi:hypothetical protein
MDQFLQHYQLLNHYHIQIGSDIFIPISLKTAIIKQYLSNVISQLTKLVSFIYAYIYEIFKRENDSIAKIYKLLFDFNIFDFKIVNIINNLFNNLFNNIIHYKLIVFDMLTWSSILIFTALLICTTILICSAIYLYEKNNNNIQTMNSIIKQLQTDNNCLQMKLNSHYKKNYIIAHEINVIHNEIVECIKKIEKLENLCKM